MTRLSIIGCGYVGAVTAACFAKLGHHIDCIDTDPVRVERLRRGISPVFEHGLDELLAEGVSSGRLTFADSYPERIDAEIVFIAVNTPGSNEGAADLRAVRDAVTTVASRLAPGSIIVNKSTVPIGTGDLVAGMAKRSGACDVAVVSNPEFLREGSAVYDFLHPDRVVLGCASEAAGARVAALYAPLGAPIQMVDIRTAEMIKYASNAFLATKISFVNEIAAICESLGADVTEVTRGMGMDSRIGSQFLNPGLGWGGSCFPKDVRALAHMAAVHGTHPQLLRSVMEINNDQRLRVVQKVRTALGELEGARITVLGAAFKANTDDIRHSPAIELANLLQLDGARVTIYDPVASRAAISVAAPGICVAASLNEAVAGTDALVVATDWAEFRTMNLDSIRTLTRGTLLVDTRNCLDPDAAKSAGFDFRCIGRPAEEGSLAELARSSGEAEVVWPRLR